MSTSDQERRTGTMSTAERAAERRRKILAKQKDRMAVATGAAESISRDSDGVHHISGTNNGLATEPAVESMETPGVAAPTGPFSFPPKVSSSVQAAPADEVLPRPSGSASKQEGTTMPVRRGTGFPGSPGDFRDPGFPSQIGPSAFGQVQDPSSVPANSSRTLEINQQRARLPRATTYLRLTVLLITSVGVVFSQELFRGAKNVSSMTEGPMFRSFNTEHLANCPKHHFPLRRCLPCRPLLVWSSSSTHQTSFRSGFFSKVRVY